MNSTGVSQSRACAFNHTFKGAAICPNKGLCAYSAARPALVFPNVHLSTFRRRNGRKNYGGGGIKASGPPGSGTTAAREATSRSRSSYHRDIQYLALHGTRGQTDRQCDVEVKSMHFVCKHDAFVSHNIIILL